MMTISKSNMMTISKSNMTTISKSNKMRAFKQKYDNLNNIDYNQIKYNDHRIVMPSRPHCWLFDIIAC